MGTALITVALLGRQYFIYSESSRLVEPRDCPKGQLVRHYRYGDCHRSHIDKRTPRR